MFLDLFDFFLKILLLLFTMLLSFQDEVELFSASPVRVEPKSSHDLASLAEFNWDPSAGSIVWTSTPQVVSNSPYFLNLLFHAICCLLLLF